MKNNDIKSIFIGNINEIDIPLLAHLNKDRKKLQSYENHGVCDRFLFSDEDDRAVVLPLAVDHQFVNDVFNLLQLKNTRIFIPETVGDSLCKSIVRDRKLSTSLTKIISSNPNIDLIAYANTPEFIELVEILKKKGLIFRTPEMPEADDVWLCSFYNSKSGFRQSVEKLKNFPAMKEGYICSNRQEIIGWAKKFIRDGGCVLKTNRGTSGEGVKIIKKADIAGISPEIYLKNILNSEPSWLTVPLVVERYAKPDLSVMGGNPSIEYKVEKDKIVPLYLCGMKVTEEGIFKGVEIGKEVAPKKLADIMFALGKVWAKHLQEKGYRGYFDIDCIFGKDGKIYPLETNVRRTGGTHVYETGKRLLGDNFLNEYYISANNLVPSERFRGKSYRTLKQSLKHLLYPINGKKEGVVITISSLLKIGEFGYMIIGENKKHAYRIEKELLKLID